MLAGYILQISDDGDITDIAQRFEFFYQMKQVQLAGPIESRKQLRLDNSAILEVSLIRRNVVIATVGDEEGYNEYENVMQFERLLIDTAHLLDALEDHEACCLLESLFHPRSRR